ncbi:MAG: hypothetical protein IJ419_07290 [Agathobacter sp.]|nr:hypothetical protein [Agathobacter sp.]
MFLSRMRMRRNPDRARAHTRAVCESERLRDKTIFSRMSTFAGKHSMTVEQLEYMIQCAKETHAKKTW